MGFLFYRSYTQNNTAESTSAADVYRDDNKSKMLNLGKQTEYRSGYNVDSL